MIKVSNKKQLKMAIQRCIGMREDTEIILNEKTKYLIFAFSKKLSQVIKNINSTSADAFLPLPKLKGFDL